MQLRECLVHGVDDYLFILKNLTAQRLQPRIAVSQGRHRGFRRKDIRLGNFIGVDRPPDLVPQCGIDHD